MASYNSAMKRKAEDQPKEQRRKKPKDMPRRPLSAYNLFFRAEREKIMDKYERGEKQADFAVPDPPKGNDPKLAKSHNAAVFQAVARTIADRWRNMEQSKKAKYEDQAAIEMKKYRSRMEEYEQHMIKNSKITKRNEERMRQGVHNLGDPVGNPADMASVAGTPSADASLLLPPTSLQVSGAGVNFTDSGLDVDALRGHLNAQLRGNSSATNNNLLLASLTGRSSQGQASTLQGRERAFGNVQDNATASLRQQVFASHSATSAQNVCGLGSLGLWDHDYLRQQLQFEQDLQQLARLRAQQGMLPQHHLSTLGGAAHGQAGLSQQNNHHYLRHQSSANMSDSSTGSSQLPKPAGNELQLLRMQAMLEQRQRSEALQQRNEALERLLMGAGAAGAPSPADLSDSNNSSQRQNFRRYG